MKTFPLIVLCFFLSTISPEVIAQYDETRPTSTLVRDHRNGQEYRRYRIETLRVQVNDLNVKRANQNQGVIGNDFYGEIEIGRAINTNPFRHSGTTTDYQPIDGFKRTLTGQLIELRYMDGYLDDDINFIIRIDTTTELMGRYRDYIAPRLQNNPNRPWSVVFAEIDILHLTAPTSNESINEANNWIKFYNKNTPGNMPNVCDSVSVFGPWVIEEAQRFSTHKNFHEIHPSEQVWWVKHYRDSTIYNFILANDASRRFTDSDDYYEWPGSKLQQVWVKAPLNGVFAIPFTLNLKHFGQIYEVNVITATNGKTYYGEPKRTYLEYKGKRLITVDLTGLEACKVSFENVGFEPQSFRQNDGKTDIISGFLVIEATIEKIPGNLKLKVKKHSNFLESRIPGRTN